MESIIEIIPHASNLGLVTQLELFIYVSMTSMAILLGIACCLLRRE